MFVSVPRMISGVFSPHYSFETESSLNLESDWWLISPIDPLVLLTLLFVKSVIYKLNL